MNAATRTASANPAQLKPVELGGRHGSPPLLAGQRVLLASVSRRGGDGVAHVARLLDRALGELTGRATATLDLEPARPDGVSLPERGRFAARLLGRQLLPGADWVLFSHLSLARAQRSLPRALQRPYAVFVHGVEAWGAPLGADRLEALRGASRLLSNSHFTARRLEALHPELAPVVPCPLALLPDAATSTPADAQLLGRVASRSALIVGRMSAGERYKGHDELLEAWPEVRGALPDAQLVIAGSGDDAARLEARARELGLADAVLFTGRVSDATLAELYRRTALFAMPSRGEGFGIVYLEAMRAGRACLASTDDGATDVVVDGETGMLVERDDSRALAGALVSLLGDRARADAMGEAGRRRFEREFTFDRFRERLESALAPEFGRIHGGDL